MFRKAMEYRGLVVIGIFALLNGCRGFTLLTCAIPTEQLSMANRQGYIMSPMYGLGQTYPSNQMCTWTFLADQANDVIVLHFEDLGVQENPDNCAGGPGFCNDLKGDLCVDDVNIGVEPRYAFCGKVAPKVCYVLSTKQIDPGQCVNIPDLCRHEQQEYIFTNRSAYQLAFYANAAEQEKGFRLHYNTAGCLRVPTPTVAKTKHTTIASASIDFLVPTIIGASIGGFALIVLLLVCVCMAMQRNEKKLKDRMRESTYTPGDFRYGTMFRRWEGFNSSTSRGDPKQEEKPKEEEPSTSRTPPEVPIYATVEKGPKEDNRKTEDSSEEHEKDRIMIGDVLYLKRDRNSHHFAEQGTTSTFRK